MALICGTQIKSDALQIPTDLIKRVICTEILSSNNLFLNTEQGKRNKKHLKKNKKNAYIAFGYGKLIYQAFLKIESSIEGGKEAKAFSHIQLEALRKFRHINKSDSNILFLPKDGDKSIHAEAQILQHIIKKVEEKLAGSKNSKVGLKEEIYIGISKKCCINCRLLLEAAQTQLKKYDILLRFGGSHDKAFSGNWGEPAFFKKKVGKSRRKTAEQEKAGPQSLSEKIRELYDSLVKKHESEIRHKIGQRPKGVGQYNMYHSPSPSQSSGDERESIQHYQERLKQDYFKLKQYRLTKTRQAAILSATIELCDKAAFKSLFNEPSWDFQDKMTQEVLDFNLKKIIQASRKNKIHNITVKDIVSFIEKSSTNQYDLPYFGSAKEDLLFIMEGDNNRTYFKVVEVKGGGDCFFYAAQAGGAALDRKKLVEKLIQESKEERIRAAFSVEIKQFLQIGVVSSHDRKEEDEACRNILKMNGNLFLQLIDEVNAAQKKQSTIIAKVRESYDDELTYGKTPQALSQFLQTTVRGTASLSDSDSLALKTELDKATEELQQAEGVVQAYCQRQDIFEAYVNEYLDKARGYIALHRDFKGGHAATSTIDIINELFGLNIQVYLQKKEKSKELDKITQDYPKGGNVVSIIHDGDIHFNRLEPIKIDKDQKNEPAVPSKEPNMEAEKMGTVTSSSTTSAPKRKSSDVVESHPVLHAYNLRQPKKEIKRQKTQTGSPKPNTSP